MFCRSDAEEDARYESFLASQKVHNESIELSKTVLRQSFDRAIAICTPRTQSLPKAQKETQFYVPSTKELKNPKIKFEAMTSIVRLPEISVTDSPSQKFRKKWEPKIELIPGRKKVQADDSLISLPESESSENRTEVKQIIMSSSEDIFTFDDNTETESGELNEIKEDPSQCEREQTLTNTVDDQLPKTFGGIKAFLSSRCSQNVVWKRAVLDVAGQMSTLDFFSESTSE